MSVYGALSSLRAFLPSPGIDTAARGAIDTAARGAMDPTCLAALAVGVGS